MRDITRKFETEREERQRPSEPSEDIKEKEDNSKILNTDKFITILLSMFGSYLVNWAFMLHIIVTIMFGVILCILISAMLIAWPELSKRIITIAFIATFFLAIATFLYVFNENYDANAHQRMSVGQNEIRDLDGLEEIALDFVVTTNNYRWGRQRIIYDLRRVDGEQVGDPKIDHTDEIFAYYLFRNRRIELFEHEFGPSATYILRVYINRHTFNNRIATVRLYGR
ncbi:MAG: SUR7/PalI family protein [Defluviitaleaceae bacterium]|nr:SUR7/PalI family protein [Defluviitaleaceae bacterium]